MPYNRCIPPEETLRRIQPLLSQAGVTRLAHLTHLDTLGVPVYTAIRPLSKSISTSQGKGMTAIQAQCSAYMEALECYYAEQVPVHLKASAQELAPTERCFEILPAGLIIPDPNQVIEWTLYHDRNTQRPVYIPTQLISLDLTQAHKENGWFHKTTAGLASGNTKEEALIASLYELIERHERKIFHAQTFHQKKMRSLNLDSLTSHPLTDLIKHFQKEDTECHVFYLSSTFNIPTFYCLLKNTHPLRNLGQYEGYGTHVNAWVALTRAITEAAQSRLTYIAGSRDDMMPSDYALSFGASFHTEQALLFKDCSRAPTPQDNQLHYLNQTLTQAGYAEQLHLTLTPQDCPICVVHSVVPGLL